MRHQPHQEFEIRRRPDTPRDAPELPERHPVLVVRGPEVIAELLAILNYSTRAKRIYERCSTFRGQLYRAAVKAEKHCHLIGRELSEVKCVKVWAGDGAGRECIDVHFRPKAHKNADGRQSEFAL